jgi:membrane protease YdiL (CAAX protease family)
MQVQRQKAIVFDLVAFFWLLLATTLTLYIFTFGAVDVQVKTFFGVVLGWVGFTGGLACGYIRIDFRASIKLWDFLGYTLLGAMMILLTNFAVNFGAASLKFAVTWDVAACFVICMAVFEEMFFRGFWLQILDKTIPIFPRKYGALNQFFAVSVAAGLWAIFHFAIYGLDPLSVVVVFGAGLILNYILLYVKRISVTMTSHAFINLLSELSFMLVKI